MKNSALSYSFSFYKPGLDNDLVLAELAQLTYHFLEELDYPYRPRPIEIIKLSLKTKLRIDQEERHIIMLDQSNKGVGFITFFVNIGTENRHLTRFYIYIKHEYRLNHFADQLFFESLKYIPDYVTTLGFFFRIDANQKFPEEMQKLDDKVVSLSKELNIKHVFTGRRSTLDLSNIDLTEITKQASELTKKANDNGYSIYLVDSIAFNNVPFTRKQFVELLEELGNDMPRDESVQEDSRLSEEDYVNWFRFSKEEKLHLWIYIATEEKTGLPIAMTETRFRDSIPELAYVGDTGVKKEHRGKQLGLTLKMLMLQQLLSNSISKESVKYWITFNAKSNNYMIAINDQLGYKQDSLEKMYELPIEKLKIYYNEKKSC